MSSVRLTGLRNAKDFKFHLDPETIERELYASEECQKLWESRPDADSREVPSSLISSATEQPQHNEETAQYFKKRWLNQAPTQLDHGLPFAQGDFHLSQFDDHLFHCVFDSRREALQPTWFHGAGTGQEAYDSGEK